MGSTVVPWTSGQKVREHIIKSDLEMIGRRGRQSSDRTSLKSYNLTNWSRKKFKKINTNLNA